MIFYKKVWEKLLESAAGVAESSGGIQVSVRPKMMSAVWEAIVEIRSALLTARGLTWGLNEDRKGKEKKKSIDKCVAGVIARLKSRRKKSQVFTLVGLQPRGLNTRAERFRWPLTKLNLNTQLIHLSGLKSTPF